MPYYMRFEALTAVNMMNTVAWDVKPCILVEIYHCFGGICCPILHGRKLGEAGSQEMLVSVKQRGITSYTPVFFIQEQIYSYKRPYMTWDD